MSRSDIRHAEYDYSIYGDGRDFHVPTHPPYAGGGPGIHSHKGPLSVARDMHRDPIPREFGPPRETTQNAAYYQSPLPQVGANPSMDANGGMGGEGARALDLGGYPAGVAPQQRMYGGVSAQPGRIVTGSDGWSSSAAPNSSRQSTGGGAVNSGPPQVQASGPTTSPHPLVLNHHHRSSPPRPPAPFSSPPDAQVSFNVDRERDTLRDAYYTSRHSTQQHPQHQSISSPHSLVPPASASSPISSQPPRSTLWWGELEPWMDEEYAKQVCNLMGWDPVNIKVPRPAPDPSSGRQVANNPGYCFLTFPSQTHAASVLAQINNASNTMTMPNSSRPFTLNWASSVPNAPLNGGGPPATTVSIPGAQNPQYPKEYSIFVGDLAPEVSNSDLVAVFRNPVLGLRNDREPRFIRPFLSCKSAKIMLDPITGVSRGYGFVRFTDEADQQRALIEMHGLYCLSRPMRISPATAKFKSAPGMPGMELAQMYGAGVQASAPADQVTIALPLPSTNQTKSVSAPLATPSGNTSSSGSAASLGPTSSSGSSLSSQTTMSSSSTLASGSTEDASNQTAVHSSPNLGSAPNTSAIANSAASANINQQLQDQIMAQRFSLSEESWKHHAQARAILSNLIGPNGEQLTSSDPYNTTVFVGGLSPLISEETLRTFFAPFGDIHYVKVPVGKHCGFVQFVRKPDAERAIEKMQGFPIGGSRIRLSWGRSQYKAAQAAAQAAQAAAFQAQYQVPQPQNNSSLTPEQAMQLLEKFGIAQFLNNTTLQGDNPGASAGPNAVHNGSQSGGDPGLSVPYDTYDHPFDMRQSGGQYGGGNFSPFSPDPNYLAEGLRNSILTQPHPQQYSYESKGYAPWYATPQEEKASSNGSGKVSPTSVGTSRPSSSNQRFATYLSGDNSGGSPFQQNRASSRQEAPIARPDLTKRPSQIAISDHSSIQDLNNTFSNLELNHTHWKSSTMDTTLARPLPTTP